MRDINERKREVLGVIYQYNRFVKPAYDVFIKPSAKWADIIVPGMHDNSVAINFIVQNLKNNLYKILELKDSMKINLLQLFQNNLVLQLLPHDDVYQISLLKLGHLYLLVMLLQETCELYSLMFKVLMSNVQKQINPTNDDK